MSYNGVGLSTARGSGTNGYIVRNTSSLQQRHGPPGGAFSGHQRYEDYLNEIAKPPVHRAPDAGILEHERKRQIEIKCLELRDDMEDRGADDDEIDEAVEALRRKLQTANVVIPGRRATDSHSVAAAKELEMTRLGRALDIRADHVEGKAFQRETDEEKAQRLAEKEEREQARVDAALKREKEEAKRKKAFEQSEKLRRREEYRLKKEEEKKRRRADRGERDSRSPAPRRDDSRSPVRRRDDSRSPIRRRDDSRSPVRRRDASPSPVRRRSPSPRRRRRDDSDSPRRRPDTPTPPPRGRSESRSRSPSDRDDSPPRRRRDDSPPRRRRYDSESD